MRASRLAPAVALLATLAAASQAGAGSSFAGNVCRLVSAKQAAAISGVSTQCTNARPSRGPGSTIYIGNWAGKTPSSPRLQVTIGLYSDPGALQLAKRNLAQGLPGPPKRVAGIGGGAYEGTGASSTGIHFAVGKYVAYITLSSVAKPARTTAPLEALARGVAARL